MAIIRQRIFLYMTDNQLKLTIGASLELDSLSDVALNDLQAELIGYTHGQGLIISRPQKDGIPVLVNSGERFIVGIKQDGDDVCFETDVVAILNDPYPHLHITYPANVRTGSIRKSSRVPAAPANIQLVTDGAIDDTPISIMNVSCSGACLVSDRRLGTVDDMFQINFHMEGDEPDVAFTCMIRHVHEIDENNQTRFSHGVFFIGMDAEEQLFLWKYFQRSSAMQ